MKKTLRLAFQTFQHRLCRINWPLTLITSLGSPPLLLNPQVVDHTHGLRTDLAASIAGRVIDPGFDPLRKK